MKTRKQWIAMLLMLAMLFTALPIAAFAEDPPAPQEGQGNEWNGEWKTVYLNVWFGISEESFEILPYKSGSWNEKVTFTQEELDALKQFYDKLPEVSTFEYRDDEGNWKPFTPRGWTDHPTDPSCRWFQAPDVQFVRMRVSTDLLPKNFSLAEFQYYADRAYIVDGVNELNLHAYKYKLIFNSNKGTFQGGEDSYPCYIQRDGSIPYPQEPKRDGYLFTDWIVPIYYKEDINLGGTMISQIGVKREKTAGMSEHVAVLKHGDTNGTFGWTGNHFWWVYEREKGKANPRTLYARWERPTLTFYKDPDTTKTDVLKDMKAYNGKSLQDTDWEHNTDLEKITELPKVTAPQGKEFKGWVYYDANNGKHDFDMTTTVDGNMKLYPVFGSSATPDPGTSDPTPSVPSVKERILFDANGGAWENGETRREYRRTVGSTITIEAAPTREGYKFLYWKGSEHHPGENYTVPAGGHTFVAQWEKVEKPSVPSVDSKIKTPRGSALTPEEIAKILAGTKKVIPAIPKAGVGR